MGVPRETAAQDLPARDLQSSEQTRRAVPLIVVRHPRRQARSQRKDRLSSVQRLNLGLLVDTDHQGLFRRVEVEPDDVGQLLFEGGIVAELEARGAVRLQLVLAPDTVHGCGAETDFSRQTTAAPVGRCLGCTQGLGDDRPLLGLADASWAAGPLPSLERSEAASA
jgi:hypothetical protein